METGDRHREEEEMRFDLHGLAWPAWGLGRAARQRDAQGADAQRDPGVGAALSQTCFHCGDAIAPASRWRTDVDGIDARFCCAGCLAVTQTIRAAGLPPFYTLRERAAPPAASIDDE